MSNATFTFGRFNPPTEEGHGKLVSAVQNHAESTGGQHYIFPTHSQDKKKNPMTHEDKVGAMRKLFPSANIVSHDKVRTAIDAMKHLESKGHKNVTMVVGSDRVDEFHKMLNKYRPTEFPGIKKVNVISAGHRDPDAEGAEGMSASKLRGLAASGKKKEFVSHYSDPKLGAHIHDKVKAGMQMESTNPVGIFLLGGPGSGKDYVLNNIFSRFDLIEVQVDQIINGSASELVEQKKNIVINGAIDADKMAIVESILEGYDLDTVYVSVTNRVSRLRNGLRDNPLIENKRIQRFLAAEKLAESIEGAFVFNNSINLNESTEMERLFFGSQIEKLLARLVEQGLKLQETAEPKSFRSIREDIRHTEKTPADYESIAKKHTADGQKGTRANMVYASKMAGRARRAADILKRGGSQEAAWRHYQGTDAVKEDIRYAERTQFPPIESLRLHAERIAEKHGVSPAEILDQLATGISVEYVKTRDHDKATDIAVKNLENQCDYYSRGTAVQEQIQRPKVPAMRYVPSEAEKVKASETRARKERVRHRWFDHRSGDIHRIATSEEKKAKYDLLPLSLSIKNPKTGQKGIGYTAFGDEVEAAKLGAQAAKKYMHNAGDTGNPVQEEKDFPAVRHHKSGLPSKYVKGLTPAEIKAKKAAIAHNARLSDKDPEAYKDMPGDKRIRAKGIPLSKYTKKYHAMYGEETEPKDQKPHLTVDSIAKKHGVSVDDIQKEFEMGQKVEHEHTQDADRAADIALNHLGEIPDYYSRLDKMEKQAKNIDEGAADSSLAKKAEKSGVSLSTLRKVYNRGVAAWNSGHRPGTTPAQWGHARVNSYITKGKTYHTADKDLHEAKDEPLPLVLPKVKRSGGVSAVEKAQQINKQIAKETGELDEDVNSLFERQFDGTSSYREYAIAMTPGQSQEIKDASGNVQKIDDEDQCGCGGDCDCNNVKDSPTGASGDRITRSLRDIRKTVKEAKGEEKVIDLEPIVQTKRKKGSKVRPIDTFDSTLQGMPTVSTAFAEAAEESVSIKEAVEYHLENNISIIENIFRPGSDMFFSMINEAKRLYKEGKYTPADGFEKDLLESDIGEKAMFEGKEVILDFPFEEELALSEMDDRTPSSDRREQRANSPEEKAKREKELQQNLKKAGPDLRKKLQLPEPTMKEESDPTGGHGIGKPFRSGGGGAVYVRTGDGGVRKVNFSQSGMKKRYMEPGRVKSFVARHHCLTNKDKTSASYWACRWPRFFSNSGKQWW